MKKKVFLVSIIFLILSFLIIWNKESKIEIVLKAVKNNKLILKDIDTDNVLRILNSIEKIEKKITINKEFDSNNINIYMVDIDSTLKNLKPIAIIRNNCAYLGKSNVIVCDCNFISTFISKTGLEDDYKKYPLLGDRISLARDMILLWVLGHELGHLTLKHNASHFNETNLNSLVENSSINHKNETSADIFLVNSILNEESISFQFSSIIVDLLNIEIYNKIGETPHGVGLHFDYNNEKFIEYTNQRSHPEFVIRASRILSIIAEKPHSAWLKELIKEFVKTLSNSD
ncbi:MAG: hypothetical protein JXQ93_02060 [Flavobacteriaceae bacterium]